MTRDSAIRLHIPGILLLVAFVLSLLLFVFAPPERVARTLFYPGTTDIALSGERRLVPRTSDQLHAIELVVEELLLGPATISHGRAFPKGTRANSVIELDGKLYVDVTETAMLPAGDVRLSVSEGIDALRRTILYNFRHLDEVIVTIEGSVPFRPSFRP